MVVISIHRFIVRKSLDYKWEKASLNQDDSERELDVFPPLVCRVLPPYLARLDCVDWPRLCPRPVASAHQWSIARDKSCWNLHRRCRSSWLSSGQREWPGMCRDRMPRIEQRLDSRLRLHRRRNVCPGEEKKRANSYSSSDCSHGLVANDGNTDERSMLVVLDSTCREVDFSTSTQEQCLTRTNNTKSQMELDASLLRVGHQRPVQRQQSLEGWSGQGQRFQLEQRQQIETNKSISTNRRCIAWWWSLLEREAILLDQWTTGNLPMECQK